MKALALSLAAVALVLLASIAWQAQLQTRLLKAAATPAPLEYTLLQRSPASLPDVMNEMAANGWEIVSARFETQDGHNGQYELILKRHRLPEP